MKTYNLVIVGFGGMGKYHINLIDPIENIKVIGTYDIDYEQMLEGEKIGLKSYSDYDSVLNDTNVDIILVATPNHTHKDIVIQGVKARKHVICEKPVTLNSADLDEMIKAAKDSKMHFFVHQNRRWDEDYLIIKDIYDSKKIGDFIHIESRVQGSRGIPGDWRKEKACGGGMMLDWGVHLLDQMLVMVNEPVKSLYCQMTYEYSEEVDDGFRLQLTFESGKTAEVEVGTYHCLTKPMWYVVGTDGAIQIDDFWSMNGELMVYNKKKEKGAVPVVAGAGVTKTMAPRAVETMDKLPIPRIEVDTHGFYNNVAEVIAGDDKPIITHEQVKYVMKIMEAAFESAESNSVITFET